MTASRGDWVVGSGSVEEGRLGKLVYGMKVDESVSMKEYGGEVRFSKNTP